MPADAVPEHVEQAFASGMVAAYVQMLRSRSDLTVNADAIAALTAIS